MGMRFTPARFEPAGVRWLMSMLTYGQLEPTVGRPARISFEAVCEWLVRRGRTWSLTMAPGCRTRRTQSELDVTSQRTPLTIFLLPSLSSLLPFLLRDKQASSNALTQLA